MAATAGDRQQLPGDYRIGGMRGAIARTDSAHTRAVFAWRSAGVCARPACGAAPQYAVDKGGRRAEPGEERCGCRAVDDAGLRFGRVVVERTSGQESWRTAGRFPRVSRRVDC